MNIKIRKLFKAGVPNEERLILDVIEDDQLGRYVVLDTRQIEPGKFSTAIDNFYWFPDRNVAAGDIVVLYTKIGSNREQKNENGTTTFFFYWNRKHTLWVENNDAAVLGKLSTWTYKTRS